jgi:hypothetical protein
MACDATEPCGILAEQTRLDLDARERGSGWRKARHFLLGQPGADRQALEVLALLEQLAEALAVLGLDFDQLARPSMVASRSATLTA